MAASLTSAITMAGAAYQLLSALREWGLSRIPRLVLTAFFVLNPMILLYGGNGMSEGLYLFTLVSATRYFLRWIHSGDLRSLAYAAIALGFSYLTRNEAIAAIIAGAVGVALVSYWRARGEQSSRRATALADAAIFAIPGVVAAAGWAIASYVITGSFFGQLSSIYGNRNSEKYVSHKSFSGRSDYLFHAITSLWPLIPVVLIVAVILAVRRHDARILAPLTVLGGAFGFDVLALLKNDIQAFYRYFIVAIPLEVLLVGSIAACLTSSYVKAGTQDFMPADSSTHSTVLRNAGAVLVIVALMLPGTITTAGAMFNPNVAPEEYQQLNFIFAAHPNASERMFEGQYSSVLRLSSYLSRLDLPNADIIVDDTSGCIPAVITTISQPKLFVIPNDRKFQRTLADPLTFNAHYILESEPSNNPVTAPNISYPTLWKTGAGFTREIHQIPARDDCPEFRLFKVTGHP
jgi:hypothetical protein